MEKNNDDEDRLYPQYGIGGSNQPTELHPMYQFVRQSPRWLIGTIARESLFVHVNGNREFIHDVRTFCAGLTPASLASKGQWESWFSSMAARHGEGAIVLLMNATQHWLLLAFDEQDEYHSAIKASMSFYRLQFATNSIIPDKFKGKWEENETTNFILNNPIAGFLLCIHMGGPLRDFEVQRMLRKTEVVNEE